MDGRETEKEGIVYIKDELTIRPPFIFPSFFLARYKSFDSPPLYMNRPLAPLELITPKLTQ